MSIHFKYLLNKLNNIHLLKLGVNIQKCTLNLSLQASVQESC